MNKITEAISLESDLLLKLKPLSEVEIFEFMKNLRGGTYFNMGMYSSIPVAKAYKPTIRIYKVLDLTAIVSGVSYENIGTTKEFRQRTGETPGKSWYDHTPGYENKVGQKKSDPNSKYVLWDIKRGSGTCVRYYVVDIDTGAVTPVSKVDIENSPYLTATEKAKLTPKPVVGFDLDTGEAVENKTSWRTAAFDHIFWLNQGGKNTKEYGTKFTESVENMDTNIIEETVGTELFRDAHAGIDTDLDAILSGSMDENYQKQLKESAEPDLYEMIAARAMHYMFTTYNMEYQEIADELGIDLKTVEELIGTDSYDDSDIILEAAEETAENANNIKGVRTVTVHNNTGEKVVLDFNTFEEVAKHFDDLYMNAVEDNYAEEVLYPILSAAREKEYDYIDKDGFAVIEVDATGIFDGALDDTYKDDVDESCQASTKPNKLKESYRRIISRGKSLNDNELFVDFE